MILVLYRARSLLSNDLALPFIYIIHSTSLKFSSKGALLEGLGAVFQKSGIIITINAQERRYGAKDGNKELHDLKDIQGVTDSMT